MSDRIAGTGRMPPHRRVRLTIVAILSIIAIQSIVHAWLNERDERIRVNEARLVEAVAGQRWLSQQIAREAVQLTHPEALREPLLAAFAATLDRADRHVGELESLLAQYRLPVGENRARVEAAAQGWRRAWRELRQAARTLEHDTRTATGFRIDLARAVQDRADLGFSAANEFLEQLRSAITHDRQVSVGFERRRLPFVLGLLGLLALFLAEPMVRQLKRQQRELLERGKELQRLALIVERTGNLVLITDGQSRTTWVNEALERVLGVRRDEVLGRRPSQVFAGSAGNGQAFAMMRRMLGLGDGTAAPGPARPLSRIRENPEAEPPAGASAGCAPEPDCAPAGSCCPVIRAQLNHRTADGRELWFDVEVQALCAGGAEVTDIVGVATDITALRRAHAQSRVAAVAFDSSEAIVITDARQRILRVNPAFVRMTGMPEPDVVGQRAVRLLRALGAPELLRSGAYETLLREGAWRSEYSFRRRFRGEAGELRHCVLSITLLRDENGEIVHFVALLTDITRQRQADETIHRLTHYDALTGLPNRHLLRERLARAMDIGEATGCHGAVLFVDLDRFKLLNDTRGHEIGDLLLVETARALTQSLRSADTVGRYGGDEFIVVVPDLAVDAAAARRQAGQIGALLHAALNRTRDLAGREYFGTASIGIHLFVGHEHTIDEVLERADVAMYQAKYAGRNRLEFFDVRMHRAMLERATLETDLHNALEAGQMRLYLQAQVDESGQTAGAEVLLRWQHPQLGEITPAVFVPIAEESGSIIPIGNWVLREACALLAQWAQQPALRALRLSVNVSPKQFSDARFVDRVARALVDTGADPRRLQLELTESIVALDLDETITTMQRVRALGAGFSIDDFGTGHSSLTYLSRLPLDELKIDQSFVRNMMRSRNDAVVVQTIIGMAGVLSIDVIAEGVETAAQHAALRGYGCRRFQGWLFGRPVPVAEFVRARQLLPAQ